MTPDEFERNAIAVASDWAFILRVSLLDKTEHAVKLRLHIDTECFVQVYANPQKSLVSYTLILNRTRIYGRDCDGGGWHRHPYDAPETHDFSDEGSLEVSLSEFLAEAQYILQSSGVL